MRILKITVNVLWLWSCVIPMMIVLSLLAGIGHSLVEASKFIRDLHIGYLTGEYFFWMKRGAK